MTEQEKKTKAKAASPASEKSGAKTEAKRATSKKAASASANEAKAEGKAEAKTTAKSEGKAAAKAAAPKKEKKAAEGVKKAGKLIEDIRLYDVIEAPVITEKSTIAAEQNKVVFKISPTATKKDVKAAVEALFGVKVEKVNTVKTKGKVKRFRGRVGQRSDVRKAVVTLKAGQTIDLAAGIK